MHDHQKGKSSSLDPCSLLPIRPFSVEERVICKLSHIIAIHLVITIIVVVWRLYSFELLFFYFCNNYISYFTLSNT